MTDKKTMHGTAKAIGCSHLRLGNFGRLLNIPMTWADDVMIGNQRRAEEIAAALGGQNGVMHDVEDASGDSVIPAAYTFFAQFVDHDITLDADSELHDPELPPHEIDGLPNLRSASLTWILSMGSDRTCRHICMTQPNVACCLLAVR